MALSCSQWLTVTVAEVQDGTCSLWNITMMIVFVIVHFRDSNSLTVVVLNPWLVSVTIVGDVARPG